MTERLKGKFGLLKKVAVKVEDPDEYLGPDDPRCQPKKEDDPIEFSTPGNDPRFQQQNQTLRCYVSYSDFYQCEHILGEGAEACQWFKRVFTSICPMAWVERWDEYRLEQRMPWFKHGVFPDAPYGKRG
ncbi:cytochrome c oxidase subunit 6B1-like [Trichogramma pretiosum]|uniref:Cytochrome c oxidase subunit n=1 Tax=Trichogramma kaykai TaxID=54128 RepID=A0ABD2XA61_9HYME|nr:cytochrome c oxidase subunit 6B1-like [Trichogramma pretiosum]